MVQSPLSSHRSHRADVPRSSGWREWCLAGLTALNGYSMGLGWQAQIVSLLDRAGRDATIVDSLLRANLLRSLALTAATVALASSVARRHC